MDSHVKSSFQVRYVCVALACSVTLLAQAPAAQTVGGVVTKMDAAAAKLTLKTDAGQEISVSLEPKATFRQVPPGETDLKNAKAITAGDIEVGDRALAVGKMADDKASIAARLVVVMSKADIANRQSTEMADWKKRGVIGMVTASAGDEFTINVQTPTGMKPLKITAASDAVIRRYTGDSIKFQDAKPSTLAAVKVGDQVRARGDKNDDGTKMTADEIVSGSFKEIAATIVSIDAAAKVLRVTDLSNKQAVMVKVTADSMIRKLPLQLAQSLAPKNPDDAAGGRGGPPQGRAGDAGEGRGRGPRGPRDLGQILDRSPAVTLADLKAGDAIILLSTVGADDRMSVITMLAGVEPILTKPGTREMALGGWSLGGGMGEQ
jgi:hypothetical protein